MKAYYNEIDPKAAQWIRELIKDGLITDGEVDERSIEDVLPADLNGFDRCHFFAGIGAWDYALNLAGWGDRQVWTGSCPCQPFSTAGKREGFTDERHLWPAWFHLIDVCRPDAIFGEQVASKDGLTWLDLVSADVEGIGYTIGAIDLPVAGVGAPHKRQRFFFGVEQRQGNAGVDCESLRVGLADTNSGEPRGRCRETSGEGQEVRIRPGIDAEYGGIDGVNPVVNTISERGCGGESGCGDAGDVGVTGEAGVCLADTAGDRRHRQRSQGQAEEGLPPRPRQAGKLATGPEGRGFTGVAQGDTKANRLPRSQGSRNGRAGTSYAGPANGFWSDVEWLYCRDEKYRATKPGIFPLADGVPNRVGLLRGAGNAISPQAAEAFIRSWMEVRSDAT